MQYKTVAVTLHVFLPNSAEFVDLKKEFIEGNCFSQCICWGINIPFDESIQKNHKNRPPEVYLHPLDSRRLQISETLIGDGQSIELSTLQTVFDHPDFKSVRTSFIVLIIEETVGKKTTAHGVAIKKNDDKLSLFDPRFQVNRRSFALNFEDTTKVAHYLATQWLLFTHDFVRPPDDVGIVGNKRPLDGSPTVPQIRFQPVLYINYPGTTPDPS